MTIPEQYLPVMPYLILDNAVKFMAFAQRVFDAKEQLLVPNAEGTQISHAEIRIGEAVIMFGSSGNNWPQKTSAMYIYVDDVKRIFDLAIGHGSIPQEIPNEKEYGFTAAFEDPFGNYWFIVQGK